jgi:hypothetical protein
MMKLPAYLVALNLSALPADYTWDNVVFNGIWAANDEDSPRLADALQLVSVKAAFTLGIACAEWVVSRVEGHVDTRDAFLRIEAAWAATLDRRYAKLPPPPPSLPSAPKQFASPLRLAMKLLSHAHELLHDTGKDVRSRTQALVMLVDHIAGRHPAFAPWLSESLRRCHADYARVDVPVEKERPVPVEFFDPDFVWSEQAVSDSLGLFIQTLDPATNLHLQSPEEMRAAGFQGVPYGPSR